jgi:hypothetical protein
MLEMLTAPDEIVAFKLSGTLTEEDFDRVVADIEARLGRHKKIGLMVDLTGFHDITLRAGLKDLRYGFGKIFEWNRFPREAIITDKQWLKTLARLASPLVPFVEVRAFVPGEEAEALAWVAEAVVKEKLSAT